jgi:hypothetical protein
MPRKKKPLPPKRKRMKRAARLQSARHWLPTYEGKNIVRGYARWFGVGLECALKEVQLLGVAVDPDYVQQLRETMRQRARSKPLKEPTVPGVPDGYGSEWDDEFACIAGYTSGGAPYGITWEEEEGRLATVELRDACDDDGDDPIPF